MDKRIVNTQKSIKKTFLEMLQETDINSIRVCELCKRANVNRATFYKYYDDQYDLLKKMENEFMEELKEIPPESAKKIGLFVQEILNRFLENKELCQILVKTSGIYFLNPFVEVTYNICYDLWKSRNPKLKDEEISSAAVYIFNGGLGVIGWWIGREFQEPVEEIALRIQNLGYLGLKDTLHI